MVGEAGVMRFDARSDCSVHPRLTVPYAAYDAVSKNFRPKRSDFGGSMFDLWPHGRGLDVVPGVGVGRIAGEGIAQVLPVQGHQGDRAGGPDPSFAQVGTGDKSGRVPLAL